MLTCWDNPKEEHYCKSIIETLQEHQVCPSRKMKPAPLQHKYVHPGISCFCLEDLKSHPPFIRGSRAILPLIGSGLGPPTIPVIGLQRTKGALLCWAALHWSSHPDWTNGLMTRPVDPSAPPFDCKILESTLNGATLCSTENNQALLFLQICWSLLKYTAFT